MSTPETPNVTPAGTPGSVSGAATGESVEIELTPEDQEEVRTILAHLGAAWWLVLILGLVSVIVGGLVLWQPFTAVFVAAIFFGVYLLVSGVLQLIMSFDHGLETGARVLSAIAGVIGIVLGIICLESVRNGIELLILFIGIWFILRGVLQLFTAAAQPSGKGSNKGLLVFLGVLGILAGAIVLLWPINSLAVLVIMAGIWLIVLGIFEVISALRIRSLRNQAASSLAAS